MGSGKKGVVEKTNREISGSKALQVGWGLGCLLLCAVASDTAFSETTEMPLARHGSHTGHLNSVGPGEAPHVHEINPALMLKSARISRGADDLPPPVSRDTSQTVAFELEAREVIAPLSEAVEYAFWTYQGTVPGPMLRVREGDTVRLTLRNHPRSTHNHSIDLHAVTGPGGGSTLTQVKPGETKTIEFAATTPGVFVYHCATPNVPSHIASGLYGLIVVDPKAGWAPVDREYYLVQGEFYTQGAVAQPGFQAFSPRKLMDERPEYLVWNGGVRTLTGNRALKALRGETLRLFIANAGVSKTLNFHVIGEILDRVFPEGALNARLESVQTTLIPAGGAAVVELKLENSGTYVLVDHALSRLERGAYGHLMVEGEADPKLLRPVPLP